MQKLCSICNKLVDSEIASILTMGGYGNPKYICDDCANDLDTATTAREYDEIKAAMDSIGEKMSKNNIDDELVIATVGELFLGAKERAKAIEQGTYDFSAENEVVDQPDTEIDEVVEEFDIPEELRESEEDKALDAAEAKQAAFYEKILNWVSLGLIVASVAAIVYLVFFR